jgi:hypothetical protein
MESGVEARNWVIYQPNEKLNLFSSPGVYAWGADATFFPPNFPFSPHPGRKWKIGYAGGGFHPQA